MINLLVDEGYAFDFLSILAVKNNERKTDDSKKALTECFDHLTNQLGTEKAIEIIQSEEYASLLMANKEVFDLVDKAKTNSCTAQDVDRGNYMRCKARKALQEKFFDTPITEQKIGYEVYDS